MKDIAINNNKYKLEKNYRDCFDLDLVLNTITDYFYEYDYIFGDFAYDKLRLKGYYDSSNENSNIINDIKYLDDYINNYCAYNAKYFLLKKIK